MSPTTRRDVLKLAAALPTIGAALSRRDALADLMQPAGLEPGNFDDRADCLFDPAAFADDMNRGRIQGTMMETLVNEAAPALNDYKQCRLALLQAHPELTTGTYSDLFVKLDEAVFGVWCDAHTEGVRLGAALEHVRLAAVGPRQACPSCDGLGVVAIDGARIGSYDAPKHTKVCPECKGSALVAAETLKGRVWK